MDDSTVNLRWCSNCLTMSTRPRISFDHRGWCNACVWMEKKKSLDWGVRKKELEELLSKHRRKDGGFDCLVPVSGGKDGSYVSYNLMQKYGMNPLTLTVTPALPLELGNQNLRAFVESGYNHISINPSSVAMTELNRLGFIEMGFPYYGWLISITTAVTAMACRLGIGLIFYGEDGETEYGGSTDTLETHVRGIDFFKSIGLEGGYDKILWIG